MSTCLVGAPAAADERVSHARRLVREGSIGAAAGLSDTLLAEPGGLAALDVALVRSVAVECALAVGDRDRADLLAPTPDSPRATPGSGLLTALGWQARAEVDAALGHDELAVQRFETAGACDDSALVAWRPPCALVMLHLGRRREALTLAHEHHDRVESLGDRHRYEQAGALRLLATTDIGGALARLREARALLVDEPALRLRAQIDTDLAGLLVLSGDASREPVRLLRSAEAYACREGLRPLQSRIRRLLERLGEQPRRLEAEVLSGLTPGERRVALLALEGLSNRQIAERLLVSVKAVEGHLSKVYRKLEVSSRRDLTRALRSTA